MSLLLQCLLLLLHSTKSFGLYSFQSFQTLGVANPIYQSYLYHTYTQGGIAAPFRIMSQITPTFKKSFLDEQIFTHKPIPPSWRFAVLQSRHLALTTNPELSDFKTNRAVGRKRSIQSSAISTSDNSSLMSVNRSLKNQNSIASSSFCSSMSSSSFKKNLRTAKKSSISATQSTRSTNPSSKDNIINSLANSSSNLMKETIISTGRSNRQREILPSA